MPPNTTASKKQIIEEVKKELVEISEKLKQDLGIVQNAKVRKKADELLDLLNAVNQKL